jgi:non-ribosomal peptide synthetase component F
VLVGICLERSLDLIIALLGILKAGGGFVPVDPSYPDKRIRFMLEDAGVQLVLTRSDCVKHLSEQAADLIVLDRVSSDIATKSETTPHSTVSPDNVVYLLVIWLNDRTKILD